MGQTAPKKALEANEFVLKDDGGSVRARLSMGVPPGAASGFPAVAQLTLLDEKGKKRVLLTGGTSSDTSVLTQHDPRTGLPGLSLYDEREHPRVFLTETDAFDLGPVLFLLDAQGNLKTSLKEGAITAADVDGFEAAIGISNLVTPRTGETHTTSAGSLILFDNKKTLFGKRRDHVWSC